MDSLFEHTHVFCLEVLAYNWRHRGFTVGIALLNANIPGFQWKYYFLPLLFVIHLTK